MTTTPHSTWSPLARLVLFMVCLAIAGTVAARALYLAVDLPAQEISNHPRPTANRAPSSTREAAARYVPRYAV